MNVFETVPLVATAHHRQTELASGKLTQFAGNEKASAALSRSAAGVGIASILQLVANGGEMQHVAVRRKSPISRGPGRC